MKPLIKLSCFSIFFVFLWISCKKETTNSNPPPPLSPGNKNPIAIAGNDTTIEFPRLSPDGLVILDGGASYDPDGKIVAYRWEKLSGPENYSIDTFEMKAFLRCLIPSTYIFALRVEDEYGASSIDTVIVKGLSQSRPVTNLHITPLGNIPISGYDLTAVSSGNKIFFTGRTNSTRIDIYDIASGSWSISQLSIARDKIAAVSADNKVFFGGGRIFKGLFAGLVPIYSSSNRVDIFDLLTNSWSVAELSIPRSYATAAAINGKVFFAGNYYQPSSKVDINDLSTNAWSVADLSVAKAAVSAAAADNRIFFAGGINATGQYSNIVDIYNASTGYWSVMNMSDARTGITSVAFGNKIYWIGPDYIRNSISGITYNIEIYDAITGERKFATTYWPSFGQIKTAIKDNKLFFINASCGNGNAATLVDIYDISSDTWSIAQINRNISGAAVISAANKIYIAGGILGTGVMTLEF